ncbi:hypothetical protein Nhal_2838 [Nitrosococcus halophilus Nc 4]|uniref:Uncharacterized protein n=1 Tax=Nitrosococcus halophilus (strain Nc4) TaxID=472759 RepID=D5BXZ2_NITHN|nr:hypothetical protein Nhal_2838 [Nitrosococcus halophilus Nc 4]
MTVGFAALNATLRGRGVGSGFLVGCAEHRDAHQQKIYAL